MNKTHSTMKVITTPLLPATREEWIEMFRARTQEDREWEEVPTPYNDNGHTVRMRSGQYTLEWEWRRQDTRSAAQEAVAFCAEVERTL